ncbi:Uncharacterized protein Rs2_42374 [Raphanus sativus]|nr:Uncharacterized protein Rs2_42374 [Raphanus sativus]
MFVCWREEAWSRASRIARASAMQADETFDAGFEALCSSVESRSVKIQPRPANCRFALQAASVLQKMVASSCLSGGRGRRGGVLIGPIMWRGRSIIEDQAVSGSPNCSVEPRKSIASDPIRRQVLPCP